MGNNCCSTKKKGGGNRNMLEYKRRNTLGTPGRPAHRRRQAVFKQDQEVYVDMTVMAKMAYEDEDKFIALTSKNRVRDLSKYVGYQLIGENDTYIILKSGKQIHYTTDWNPLTFALMFDKKKLLKYILEDVNFNMPQMLATGLPQVTIANRRDWTENELIDGQIKTLLMLVENMSDHLSLILNKFSHFISEKLLYKFIPLAARTRFGSWALSQIMQS